MESLQGIDELYRSLHDARQTRNAMQFGKTLELLAQQGISIADDSLDEELWEKYIAELTQMDEKYRDVLTGRTKKVALRLWENGRTPSTRDGYRHALSQYHRENGISLPRNFSNMKLAQLEGMYHGILRSQKLNNAR